MVNGSCFESVRSRPSTVRSLCGSMEYARYKRRSSPAAGLSNVRAKKEVPLRLTLLLAHATAPARRYSRPVSKYSNPRQNFTKSLFIARHSDSVYKKIFSYMSYLSFNLPKSREPVKMATNSHTGASILAQPVGRCSRRVWWAGAAGDSA
jgi:hypothetical protein